MSESCILPRYGDEQMDGAWQYFTVRCHSEAFHVVGESLSLVA